MKKKHTIVIAVIIIALVAVGLIFVSLKSKLASQNTDNTDTTNVGDDTDNDGTNNGNNNGTDGTVSTVPMRTYTDPSNRFSFLYPTTTSVQTGTDQPWSYSSTMQGTEWARVEIPGSMQPGTNFASSRFTVGSSKADEVLFNCLIANNGETSGGVVTINNEVYNVFMLGDAGAGNYYETTSYRTIRGDECIAVEYTIHSTSLGAYDPGTVKAFDKAKATAMFEKMARSFKLLTQ